MSNSEEDLSLKFWLLNICPNCGKIISEGTRVESGRKSDGGFCSLNCYATFHETELIKRAEILQRTMERIHNN